MRWRRQDVVIASRFSEAMLSITREWEAERIEGADLLKYLRRI